MLYYIGDATEEAGSNRQNRRDNIVSKVQIKNRLGTAWPLLWDYGLTFAKMYDSNTK